jgi:hypothetical protein
MSEHPREQEAAPLELVGADGATVEAMRAELRSEIAATPPGHGITYWSDLIPRDESDTHVPRRRDAKGNIV